MKEYSEVYLRPAAMNMVCEDKKIWMALANRNGICEIDKETRQARICKIFDGEPLDGEMLYCHAEKVGSRLIFSPGTAGRIAVYDLKCGVISYIPLRKLEHSCKQNQDEVKFWNIVRHHSDVYLVGYSYPAIVKINMKSMEVSYITDWVETIEKEIPEGDTGGYFADGYVISDEIAILPISDMGAVLELNLKTDHTAIRKLNISVDGIRGLSSADGENIWLVGSGKGANQLFCWNRRTNKTKAILLTEEADNIFDPFYAPICTEFKVFLMPISASNSYEIYFDGEMKKISKMMGIESNSSVAPLWPWWKTMAPQLNKNWLIYLTCEDLKWHEYNVITGEHFLYNIHLEEDIQETERFIEERYRKQRKSNSFFSELKIPLNYFLDRIQKPEKKKEDEENISILVGKRIYEQLCRKL